MAPNKRLVITVHGIRTFGQWQERLERLLRESEQGGNIEVVHYKYGYVSIIALWMPALRWLAVRRFRTSLVAHCSTRQWTRIDIVAHSFGTHLVAWAIHGLPMPLRPSIHTFICAASVLREGFPWCDLLN